MILVKVELVLFLLFLEPEVAVATGVVLMLKVVVNLQVVHHLFLVILEQSLLHPLLI